MGLFRWRPEKSSEFLTSAVSGLCAFWQDRFSDKQKAWTFGQEFMFPLLAVSFFGPTSERHEVMMDIGNPDLGKIARSRGSAVESRSACDPALSDLGDMRRP